MTSQAKIDGEQMLALSTRVALVSDDEREAYLQRVAEARERLKEHAQRCKLAGREFPICGTLD